MEITKILGNIRRAREAKGMSQADMGFMLTMSQSNYSNIESGKNKLTLDHLQQIAKIVEVPVEKLLNVKPAQYRIPEPNQKIDDGQGRYNGSNLYLDLLQQEIEQLLQQKADMEAIVRELEKGNTESSATE